MKETMSKYFIFFFVTIVLLCSIAEASMLSVESAVKSAVANNPEITAAKNSLDAAKAKVPQMIALADPKIGLEYDQIPSGSRNLEDGMKMYTVEQMVMFPGKIYADYSMAVKTADLNDALYRAKLLEISSQVKSAYYDLYFIDRSIVTMREVGDLFLRIKKSAQAKYAVGAVMQMDVLQANIEYQLINNELLTMAQERGIKEARLKVLLNRSDGSPIEVDQNFALPETVGSVEVLVGAALEKRPELLAMKAEYEMKDAAHLKSKMEFFPDTMLGAKKRVGDGWDAMLSFSVPLYFWKQSYNISSVGLESEAAEAAYNNMKNMTVWEVKEDFVKADAALRTFSLYKEKIIPQSEQALKVALRAYQGGKADFQALLLAERMVKEAKLKLYENQASYGKALAELERIIGKEVILK